MSYSSKISINLTSRRLTHWERGRIKNIYPISVGRPARPTPTGNFRIVTKRISPGGVLGSRWLGLSIPHGNYGIHGTNEPRTIGGYTSNGCIRMRNRDVEELYPQVEISTPVQIIAEPLVPKRPTQSQPKRPPRTQHNHFTPIS